MRLSLQLTGPVDYGEPPTSHLVALPHNDKALLEELTVGSWRLTIYCDGVVIDRGLFGSTYDILALLEAEYFPDSMRR